MNAKALPLAHRYIVTLGANCLRGFFLYLSGIIIARSLAVQEYGDYAYLLAIFIGLNSLLDLGGNTAFYTFLAERPRTPRFIATYLTWQLAQLAVVTSIIYVLPESLARWLWPNLGKPTICMGFIAVFWQYQLWTSINSLGDAVRHTSMVQFTNVLVSALYFLILAAAPLWTPSLTIDQAFFGLFIAFFAVSLPSLIYNLHYLSKINYLIREENPSFWHSVTNYRNFCLPLAINGLIIFAGVFFGRWIVQWLGGSETQAYFSVGQHLAMPTLLLSTSLARLIWKEVAEASHDKDREVINALFKKSLFGLTLVNAFWICFILPWMDLLVPRMLGAYYREGGLTSAILLTAGLFQGLGQIISVFYYGTYRTKQFSTIMCLTSSIEIAITYLYLTDFSTLGGPLPQHTGIALIRCAGQIIGVGSLIYLFSERTRRLTYILLGIIALLTGFSITLAEFCRYLFVRPGVAFSLAIAIYLCSAGLVILKLGVQSIGADQRQKAKSFFSTLPSGLSAWLFR